MFAFKTNYNIFNGEYYNKVPIKYALTRSLKT